VSTRSPSQTLPVAGFLPHLDGLRALAVVLVLCYHGGIGFPGGYVGVDVFLVLSGFLITALLLGEHASGGVSLRSFWGRRVRRLLPVAALVVVSTALVGVVVLEPQRLSRLAGDVFASASMVANFRFLATHGDYLGGLSLPSPLLHFWSLALEEQFYLVWPLLLVLSLRVSRRAAALLAGVLFAGSLTASVVFTSARPAAAYYLLPTRAWELLAGALLALCWRRVDVVLGARRVVRSVVGLAGLGALVFSGVWFDRATPFPGVAALLPVLGTLAVLAAGASSVSGSLLSVSPLLWLGARSYGVYLWHWPVLVMASSAGFDGGTWGSAGLLVCSLVLAALSFRLLESPLRRSRVLAVSPARSFVLGGVLSASVLGVGLVVAVLVPPPASPAVAARPAPVALPAATVPASTVPVSAAPAVPPRVLLLGDSTLAPLRWFVDGARPLSVLGAAAEFVVDAESCRRLSLRSCSGREKRRPATAVQVLAASPERFRHVVVMGGYHSTPGEFAGEFEDLLTAASEHGVERLYVLDYRESLAFPLDGSQGRLSVYGSFNDTLRSMLTVRPPGALPRVVVLGWNEFTAGSPDWFRSDGIHTNLAGTLGLGEFLVRGVLADLGLPCGEEPVCRLPSSASAAADVLAAYGVVDTDEHCYEVGPTFRRECRPDRLR